MATTQPDAEAAIRVLLERRDHGKTICPSEAARALAGEDAFGRHGYDVALARM